MKIERVRKPQGTQQEAEGTYWFRGEGGGGWKKRMFIDIPTKPGADEGPSAKQKTSQSAKNA